MTVGVASATGGTQAVDDDVLLTATYLTFENARQRFVFQLRIPADLQQHYAGRKSIRKSLGNIPPAAAETQAIQLARAYLAEFDVRRTETRSSRASTPSLTQLAVMPDTGERLAATWQRAAARVLADLMITLQVAPAEDWEAAAGELGSARQQAQEQLRRADMTDFHKLLTNLGREHAFVLNASTQAIAELGRHWLGVQVSFLGQAQRVLAGELPLDALLPPPHAQLPLLRLWGTPAMDLPERWQESKKSIGLPVNQKTLDKYRLLARDCDAVLSGRPVESLNQDDLKALKTLWLSQGNAASTLACKLDQLKQLIRQLGKDGRIEAAFAASRPSRVGKLKTKRMPFTQNQVTDIMSAFLADKTLPRDDLMLVYLLFLSGARLEELCQLTAADLTLLPAGWQLRLAEGRHTGTDSALKNTASARRLTIPPYVLPDLDAWLQERANTGDRLFPDLTPNRYNELSNAAGKRLNRRVRAAVGADRRLVLLSSRPTVNRVMRRAGVDPRVRHRQLGHADLGIHDRHYDAAEHFDDEDLLPAAGVIAGWLADCLRIEAAPGVDGQISEVDTSLREINQGMPHERNEATG